MKVINIGDAKAHLSKLIELALAGQEIVIGKRNKPLIKLVPLRLDTGNKRQGGQWKGRITLAEDFDILPEGIEKAFKGLLP